MADPSSMLEQFAKFLLAVETEGRSPSEEDIDYFLSEFFNSGRNAFIYKGYYIYAANRVGEDGNKLYDVQGKSYDDLINETKPLLQEVVGKAYSSVSQGIEAFDWDTKPRSIDTYAEHFAREMNQLDDYKSAVGTQKRVHPAYQKAINHSARIKYRIKMYMQSVVPYILRHTMYHELSKVTYNVETGVSELVKDKIKISSEEGAQNFVNSNQLNNLRSIFWVPTESGKNIKMGVVNIDNPAELPEKMVRNTAKRINRILENLGHPTIIMFTGANYQVWFGQNNDQLLLDVREVNEYLQGILVGIGQFTSKEAIDEGEVFIDLSINKAGGSLRSFFSLHYPSGKKGKIYSGLSAVPVAPGDLDKFVPVKDAHPEKVLANLQFYSSYVSTFYDAVRIGQDHESEESIESPPTCARLEKEYKKSKMLKYLFDEPIQVEIKNVEAVLEDESSIHVHPNPRGVPAVLVYDPLGSNAPSGMSTKRLIRGRVETKPASVYYITIGGQVIYDDYICRDFERYCLATGLRSAIITGVVTKIDELGNETSEQDARFTLIRKDGLDPIECSKLRFAATRIEDLSGDQVPVEIMGEQLSAITTKRVLPVTYTKLGIDVGAQVKRMFTDFVEARYSGSMTIYGDNKYLVKSTRTIRLAVLGVKESTKVFDSKEIPPVYVGVGKRSSKYGIVYYLIGLAQIALTKEERIRLRELVFGENDRNLLPPGSQYQDDIRLIEPTTVVEVAYDDISPSIKSGIGSAFMPDGKYRILPGKEHRYVTPLVNAKVIAIREDLDSNRQTDISFLQEPLVEYRKKPTSDDSLLGALPNPGLVDYIRRNPAFFGVPQSLRVTVGGVPREPTLAVDGDGNPILNEDGEPMIVPRVDGGREIKLPLFTSPGRVGGEVLPGELEKAFDRFRKGEPGYKVYVEPRSLVKSGDPQYFRISNLGDEYQIAVDDERVQGADGNAVTTVNKEISAVNNYIDVINMQHLANKQQAEEDMKIVAPMLEGRYQSTWHDPNSEIETYRYEDEQYIADYKKLNDALRKAQSPTAFDSKGFENLSTSVMQNPRPVKEDSWGRRVNEYILEYNKWAELPQPKEMWERYSLALGPNWEVPILEKERMMRSAKEMYDLTEGEVEQIDGQFAEPLDDKVFDSIFSDLYEVPEDDNYEE